MGLPYFTALFGEAVARAGKPEAGIEEIERAIATANEQGAGFQISEMLRLKGELLSMVSRRRSEVEGCFRESIAAANAQHATLPKLRSAVSLARLLSESGKRDAARAVLRPAHEAVPEGLNLPDLTASAALLAELR
jgi:hypothetical protein